MPIEGLDGKTCAHVPNGHGSVCGATDKEVGKRLEVQPIDGVCVLSVLLAHLEGMEIEKFHRAVFGGGEGEVAGVVEFGLPDGPGVHVGECV